MTENSGKVDVMQKVTLIPARETEGLSSYSYEFIFGIGSSGLTPFEFELANRKCGDTVRISIRREIIPEYFGHLAPPVLVFSENEEILQLDMKIQRIEKALPSELVRAMAKQAEGCACGCGGHGHDSTQCNPAVCNFHGQNNCACSH